MSFTEKNHLNTTLFEEYEINLIFEAINNKSGISQEKAAFISTKYDTIETFLNVSQGQLFNLQSDTGRKILNASSVNAILEAQREIVEVKALLDNCNLQNVDIRHLWIFYLTKDFISKQIYNLNSKSLDDIAINPHLTVLLNFKKKEAIEFFVMQTISRSIVTSWGMYVERFLKYSGCEVNPKLGSILFNKEVKDKIKGSNVDIFKIFEDTIYAMQVKSGPNTMNIEMVSGLNKAMEVIDNIDIKDKIDVDGVEKIKGILGMTYGQRNDISPQIKGTLNDFDDKTKIGRELWNFIGEENSYYLQVLELMDCASKEFLKIDFMSHINSKITEMLDDWNKKYGDEDFYATLKSRFV